MIQTQMVVIVVNFLTVTRAKYTPFNSSSSGSEEEEDVQPEPDRGGKRRRVLHKCADTDFELGWKKQIWMVQKSAFSGVTGINKNFSINI